jgi:hypothetical protein
MSFKAALFRNQLPVWKFRRRQGSREKIANNRTWDFASREKPILIDGSEMTARRQAGGLCETGAIRVNAFPPAGQVKDRIASKKPLPIKQL